MSAGEIPGVPPGLQSGETVQINPVKQTTFTEFAIADPVPTPDGGMQVAFIVPATREVLVFPMNAQVAETLGKKLTAPRVALPGNGLHSVS